MRGSILQSPPSREAADMMVTTESDEACDSQSSSLQRDVLSALNARREYIYEMGWRRIGET